MDALTKQYYEQNAKQYALHTVQADMHVACDRFLSYVKENGRILDFGCGSGRDSLYFKERGYEVTAIDGCKALCAYAESLLQQPVLCMDFKDFHEVKVYDGIWACASLLHCEWNELVTVLKELHTALRESGVLYASFKYGDFYGYRDEKFYQDMHEERLEALLKEVTGFVIEEVTVSEDVEKRGNAWLNVIVRKVRVHDY